MARNINTCRGSWVNRRICSRRHGSRLVDSRVGGILLGSHLDWRSLIWSRLWKWRDERQRLSHRACQKFVHTNFVSEQLNENLYNKLQYFFTSSRMWIQSLDVLHNERPLILHFENFNARVCDLILHERSSTASRVWPLQFFKFESSWLLGCLHSFWASSSLGEISPQWATWALYL